MGGYGGAPPPYDPLPPSDPPPPSTASPAFVPGPPPLGATDPGVWARRRANLDAGARPRLSSNAKAVITLAIILAIVGSCGALVWFSFGQHFGLADEIRGASGGRAEFVQIVGVGAAVAVQVILADDVTEAEARDLVCEIVFPRLAAADVEPIQVSLTRVGDGGTMSMSVVDPSECPP